MRMRMRMRRTARAMQTLQQQLVVEVGGLPAAALQLPLLLRPRHHQLQRVDVSHRYPPLPQPPLRPPRQWQRQQRRA